MSRELPWPSELRWFHDELAVTGMGECVRDRRRIQTAVLGSADSDEPLMLPMEAIALDAFRHAHESNTFWCGTLLGGCGGQLTTKLYTDRACHFAHHPDPDGLPHVCGRRARGVNSADHLYVKSAAAAWLAHHGEQASIEYSRPGGAPLGSVVDIRWPRGALRVHLDQAVAPVWDDDAEPVLGTMVPVDRETLIRRWYVHRIRLGSVGTARHVQVGTEAFARPTEWFALDECEMTERGLSTPAVEQVVEGHNAPRPTLWAPGKTKKVPAPEARAQALLRRLVYARRIESASLAKQVCLEIEDLTGVEGELREQLEAAVRHAKVWLVEQDDARRGLFAKLKKAVADQKPGQVRRLLIRINATAAEDRTDAEAVVYERAVRYFASLDDQTREAVEAEAATEKEQKTAASRTRSALYALRGYDAYTSDLRPQVEGLLRFAALAGDRLTRGETRRVEVWKSRAANGPQAPLSRQVARRNWIKRSCPRCLVDQGENCVLVDGPDKGKARQDPHNERLRPIVDERKAAQKLAQQQQKARKPVAGHAEPMPLVSKEREAGLERRVQEAQKANGEETQKERKKPTSRLHHQVPRGDWYSEVCPRCDAGPTKLCANDDRLGPGEKRQLPHNERLLSVLQRIDRGGPEKPAALSDEPPRQAPQPAPAEIRPPRRRRAEREARGTAGSAVRTWSAEEVTCPRCRAGPNTQCTPNGMHTERAEWAREFTRRLWG
ncbi:hypothetical protein RCO28_34525 [Streptomyces sp. LHD-70]|uniref:hypothetical protein n=1 Tax=Streptomyces sp. LHD-70 TaxID=3072140 RepID=UPI0028103C5E|nr:hypothetical protein [Streptomyces sp. LHD-70]MDQ8707549.1 hypothetical protein [Streptomyces sp. LHD-70]